MKHVSIPIIQLEDGGHVTDGGSFGLIDGGRLSDGGTVGLQDGGHLDNAVICTV
jgi:hypothetical protein